MGLQPMLRFEVSATVVLHIRVHHRAQSESKYLEKEDIWNRQIFGRWKRRRAEGIPEKNTFLPALQCQVHGCCGFSSPANC